MKNEKTENFVANLHDKTEYVIYIRNSKQALDNRLALKKIYWVIKINQSAWLKPYTDMNTDLRKKSRHDFEKGFFKLMNNAFFKKAIENVSKHRDINFPRQKKKEIIYYNAFHRASISSKNEKSRGKFE